MRASLFLSLVTVWSLLVSLPAEEASLSPSVEAALVKAGDHRSELESALQQATAEERVGLEFLIENMPERDLTTLSGDFLLKHVRLAYETREKAPWGKRIPEAIFLNDVLPYANVNETREDWRSELHEQFYSLVEDCQTPAEVGQRLNESIFDVLNVRYSTERPKADQSPAESIEAGLASCTGLSILLSDACRAVGVPARLVGTPLWTTKRGNHTWVEIWDDGWHFTGAAEPSAKGLNDGWFVGDASKADPEKPEHWIYAASFKQTGTHFPMVWARRNKEVPAENVTARYVALREDQGEKREVRLQVYPAKGEERIAIDLTIKEAGKEDPSFEGRSRDASNDTNDILTFLLKPETDYEVELRVPGQADPY